MNKHTSGPWRLGKNSDSVVADTPPRDYPAIHEMTPAEVEADSVEFYGGHLIAESVCRNNRHIISAAPELLAALEAIIESGELPYCDSDPMVVAAKKAIAKAKPTDEDK